MAQLKDTTVTGDLTVSGMINGRDVATDGLKLDGIEEGAQVNVNADWNSVSGDSQILNKPTDITDLSTHASSELSDGADLVKGPASSTVGYIAVADDTSGKSIKYVPVTVDNSGNVVIPGNATINGTLTTINSETLQVKDKNIEIAKVDAPTDDTADGGGITLLGATNKTITWVKSKLSWVFNQAVEIAGDLNVIGTIKTNGTQISTSALSDGANLVKGPASSTDNTVPVYADGTGKLLKDSTGVSIVNGNFVMSKTSSIISTDTTDDADNKRILISGGGGVGNTRGGYIELMGNEYPGGEGDIRILAGDASLGTIRFYTGAASEKMRIQKNGNIGIGTNNPSEKLHVVGNIAVSGKVNGRNVSVDGAKLDESVDVTSGVVYKKFAKTLDITSTDNTVTLFTVPSSKIAFMGFDGPKIVIHSYGSLATDNAVVRLTYESHSGSGEVTQDISLNKMSSAPYYNVLEIAASPKIIGPGAVTMSVVTAGTSGTVLIKGEVTW